MRLQGAMHEVPTFVAVGVSATATQVLVSLAAQRLLGLGPMTATFVGYAASVGVSYLGNSLLTFRRPALHGGQFLRFATISLAGLGVNQGVVFVATHLAHWPLWQALIPVVLIVPASTFVMSKFWAFKPAPAVAVEAEPS